MAVTTNYDESQPPDSQDPRFGAQRIREALQRLRERLVNGGVKVTTTGAIEPTDGRLTCGVQGTTGVLNLAHEADGDVAIIVRDGTDVGGDAEVVIGTGVGGARPYELIVDQVTAATYGAIVATTLSTTGATTLGDAAGDAITINGATTFASNATVTGSLVANGGVALGDTAGDNVAVNGVLSTNALATLAHSFALKVRDVGDAAYAVAADDVVVVVAPSVTRAVTLPLVSTTVVGRVLIIVNRSASQQVTVTRAGADVITTPNDAGAATFPLPGATKTSAILVATAAGRWSVVATTT